MNAQYNFLYGERSNGKSFWVKEYCVTSAYKKGELFVLLRRWQVDVKTSNIEAYFADCPISAITNGKYNTISVWAGNIYLANITDDSKVIRGDIVGRTAYLSGGEHFKSQAFPNYKNIIYEEVTTKDSYLQDEPNKLMDFVSTVARRNSIRVWLIGNTVSRICPYFHEWNLKNIPTQKQGTIDLYEIKTDEIDDCGNMVIVKIAVEYCENSGNNSKMFFGNKSKMITSGAWETDIYNAMPKGLKTTLIYEVMLCRMGFSFIIQLHVDNNNGGVFVFIYPRTSKRKIERVISDIFSTSPFHSEYMDKNIKAENDICRLIEKNKVVFSDALTKQDFFGIINMKGLIK